MNTTNNTVLITGGSAGIGFEIAKLLSSKGNHVIITGRDADRLRQAASQLSNVTAIVGDVSSQADITSLVSRVKQDFPNLNILINNAGRAFYYKLGEGANAAEKAAEEMLTNYISNIRLTEKLLPVLSRQSEAAIVNVTSIAVFAARHTLSTYSASKAALHSYTQSLRITLAKTSVKVFELMPPLVNTSFSTEIGGASGIAPSVVADEFLTGLESDNYEIRVGNTEKLYRLYLANPADALLRMNPAE